MVDFMIILWLFYDYLYQQLFENGTPISEANCTKYDKISDYPIYGYGLEKIKGFKFRNIIPDSKNLALYAKKNYQDLVVEDINKIKPKYLSI